MPFYTGSLKDQLGTFAHQVFVIILLSSFLPGVIIWTIPKAVLHKYIVGTSQQTADG